MENVPDEIFLPLEIQRHKNLKAPEKLLYGDLFTLADKNDEVVFDEKQHADLFGVSKVTVRGWLRSLINKNLISYVKTGDIVEELKRKNMNGLGFDGLKCNWCGVKTSVLHSHHYPIPKSEGGQETVDICPNCHHEFHYHKKKIKVHSPHRIKRSF